MAISRLALSNFRNLSSADLRFHPRLNLIQGENGAGKTSLLEALGFVCLGRSFRTHKSSPVIQHEKASFELFAEVHGDAQRDRIGISKSRNGSSKIKINGSASGRLTDLAKITPLKTLDHQAFALLEGGPNERRRYLDWLLFHVKHNYSVIWNQGNRCLKQRNALLKEKHKDKPQIEHWTRQFVSLSNQIDEERKSVLSRFMHDFNRYKFDIARDIENGTRISNGVEVEDCSRGKIENSDINSNISFDFFSGWPVNERLEDVLVRNYNQDCKQGFTSKGFHKADLRFRTANKPVEDTFSRGQIKRFVAALTLAQIDFLQRERNIDCVLLIDDLSAELDAKNQSLIFDFIKALKGVQTFITGIDFDPLFKQLPEEMLSNGYNMFHVKHGEFDYKTM